jgi:hypothetical protein
MGVESPLYFHLFHFLLTLYTHVHIPFSKVDYLENGVLQHAAGCRNK